MAAFNYIVCFQLFIMLDVIVAVGYIFGWRKKFTIDDSYAILRVVRIICYPGLMFYELSKTKPDYFTWKPIIVSFLTILSSRLITIIAALIFPGKQRFLRYLQLSFSYCYPCFYSYGYPVIRKLFGEEYLYIVVIVSIINFFIMRPIDVILMNTVSPKSVPNESVPTNDFHENAELDGEHQLEEIEHEPQDSITEYLVPEKPAILPENYIFHDEGSLKKRLLLALFSSQNIFTVIGICYSFTGWPLPLVVSTVAKEFMKLLFATSLFFSGVALWSHPFKGCNWFQVVPCLVMKHVIMPLIAALFCWVFKFDSLNAKACILLFSMPADYTGIGLLSRNNLTPNPITFSFFFSQLIGFPCFMLWIVVFNQTNIFN